MSNLLVLEAILTGGSILEIITSLHSTHYFILMIAQGRDREGQMEIYFLSGQRATIIHTSLSGRHIWLTL